MGSIVTVDLSIVEFGSSFQVFFKWGSNFQVFLKIRLRAPKSFVELILHTRNKKFGIKCANYFTFCKLYYLCGKWSFLSLASIQFFKCLVSTQYVKSTVFAAVGNADTISDYLME